MKKLLFIILSVVLFVACANIGSPDGGAYDEKPPVVTHTSPRFGATNTKAKKVTLMFNENIKLDNASEKVIVSPPQLEQPEIDATGKKITVTFADSMQENTTYTIDFADAIEDNNEGNPMGDYAFTFSTGSEIDTFQVSGYVLEAENLEPIKGIFVGLYRVDTYDGDSTDVDSDNTTHIREKSVLPDSVFRKKPFERISRTDSRGHFVVKGLKKGARYRAFALEDKNQNYCYDQKGEKLAFNHLEFSSSCRPDTRPDTIWHDSIYFDSIVDIHYTHFFPDDIILKAFQSAKQDRYKLKEERPELKQLSFIFSSRSDTLPKIRGINFNADSAFIVDASEYKDTLTYWIKDSLVYNIDTLQMYMDYWATDTTGVLKLRTDTLEMVSKISRQKVEKEKQKAWEEWEKEYKKKLKEEAKAKKHEEGSEEKNEEKNEDNAAEQAENKADEQSEEKSEEQAEEKSEEQTDVAEVIEEQTEEPEVDEKNNKKSKKEKKKKKKDDFDNVVVPPMPEEFLDVKIGGASLDPDKNVDFTFNEPLDSVNMNLIRFFTKKDSIEIPEKFIFKKVKGKTLVYNLYAEWIPDSTYYFEADTGAFVNIYGKRSDQIKKSIKVGNLDSYSTLFVKLQNTDPSAVVQLLDGSDKVQKTVKSENGKADFYFIKPGTYYMRLFYDRNGNGVWDSGEYDEDLQPEEVFYYDRPMELKVKWTIEQPFNPTSLPIYKQKPAKITKQKPDKDKKSTRDRNKERLQEKQSSKKGKSNGNSVKNMNMNMNSF